MSPARAEVVLVWLLRFAAAMTLLAFGAVLLPESSMASTHRWLGLGPYPAAPLTDYLARSVAALYGFHGAWILIVSTDVRRYRKLAQFLGWMDVSFGALLLLVDFRAGLPAWWTAIEGPSVILFGVAILWTLRHFPEE